MTIFWRLFKKIYRKWVGRMKKFLTGGKISGTKPTAEADRETKELKLLEGQTKVDYRRNNDGKN